MYIEQIEKEKQELESKLMEERKKNQFVKGYDEEVREFKDHLSFEYLSSYESSNWFKVKDYSSNYESSVMPEPVKEFFTTPNIRHRKKKGFIFFSD